MAVRALRFTVDHRGLTFIQSQLTAEFILRFSETRLQQSPAAYLATTRDLKSLEGAEEVTINRGRKHPAKQLSRLVLGHSKIPLIDGSYESAGQVKRSLRTLLENAFDKDEHNIYLIGASERIFDALWSQAAAEVPPGATKSAWPVSAGAKARRRGGSQMDARALLDILPHYEIPAEFAQTFVGESVEVQLVRQLVMRAARVDEPVLIIGDTGTGKEVVARAIHNYSSRNVEKFVPVNCGAIPRDLFESELFGHRRSSFTDARFDKKGMWEVTGNGTLFLDEIGDLSLDHQVKILRALQENRIRPIGEVAEIKVGARVIAATNRDLFGMVRSERFREDLYYRLRAFQIRTPALADHPSDIPLLANFFWKGIAGNRKAELPANILTELGRYGWPGNARELKAVLMNVASLFGLSGLEVTHLNAVFHMQGQSSGAGQTRTPEQEILQHRGECLRHLRRVDEVVRAARVAVGPAIDGGQTGTAAARLVRASLAQRISELELLSRQPLLFHSLLAFEVIERLKEKLSGFSRVLESDPLIARSYWLNEVEADFSLALSAIFQESERLTANI